MNGYLNILKAPGSSSGAVVNAVKRLTGERVGHAGTLDPEAAGVLPVMVGRATRLMDFFPDKGKSYVAEIAFTGATDTQDAQGRIITRGERVPEREEVEAVLPRFLGRIWQYPPAYSAVKLGGVPAYARARRGETVETKCRETEIYRLELGEETQDGYMLFIDCGSGTYIRTLCHDIGQALAAPAHMRFLLRTRHGRFGIGDSVTLEELETGDWQSRLLPMEYALEGIKRGDVSERFAVPANNGARLPAALFPELKENEQVMVYLRGVFTAIYHREGDTLKSDIGLTGGK